MRETMGADLLDTYWDDIEHFRAVLLWGAEPERRGRRDGVVIGDPGRHLLQHSCTSVRWRRPGGSAPYARARFGDARSVSSFHSASAITRRMGSRLYIVPKLRLASACIHYAPYVARV